MYYDSFGVSAGTDPFSDFFAHQDQLDQQEAIPSPDAVTKAEPSCERQGDPHRMRKVGDALVDDYASNYSLPDLDDISWMRVELFHNTPGNGQSEWVLKFIINQCNNPNEVNTSTTTREVFFNLFSGYALNRAVKNCKENEGFMQRFQNKVHLAKAYLKGQKQTRKRGEKRVDTPVDKVIAGFCYVKKAPWGTVTFPQQQAIVFPTINEADEHIAVMNLRQNEQKFRTIILRDVRNHVPSGAFQRADNAAVMVGYLDQVGYREWLHQQGNK